MNNLVSKNPVQRFKEGRKIVKALGGLPMVINSRGGVPATRTVVGGVPAVRNTVGGVPSVVSKTTNAVSKVGRGLLGRAGSFQEELQVLQELFFLQLILMNVEKKLQINLILENI